MCRTLLFKLIVLTNTSGRVESRNTSTTSSQALGNGSLRSQFDGELTAEIFLLDSLVLTQKGQNQGVDLARLDEDGQTILACTSVVGDGFEVVDLVDTSAAQSGDNRVCRYRQNKVSTVIR